MHQTLANATFQVIAGDSRGSGFSFMREDLVVTNFHVVATCCDLQSMRQINNVTLQTEANEHIGAQILHVDGSNDFAIMQLQPPPSWRKNSPSTICWVCSIQGQKSNFCRIPAWDTSVTNK